MENKNELEAIGIKSYECKKCNKTITKIEAETNKGFCTKCYLLGKDQNVNSNIDTYESKSKSNIISIIIKLMAIVGGIIGVIFGFSLLDSYKQEGIAIPMIITSIVSTIFIYGFGEIIQLLEDIKNK